MDNIEVMKMCQSGPRPLECRTKAGFYPLDSNPRLENVRILKVLIKVNSLFSRFRTIVPESKARWVSSNVKTGIGMTCY